MCEIYLDNSATTKTYKEVNETFADIMENCYGNPSSLHTLGIRAEKEVKNARRILAEILGAEEKEILFTSGGTESDNIALLGYARANKKRGKHIITSNVEHPAVSQTVKQLEEEGFSVDYLKADKNGRICAADLENMLKSDTILVAVMYVNNEVGSIMPIETMKPLIRSKSPHCALFTDAVQGFGKLPIKPEKSGIDMLSISGHKIHGPKGIGALYIKQKTIIRPILFGGHQQNNLRSGTENVAAIAGLAKAAQICYANLPAKQEKIKRLRDTLKNQIAARIENVVFNSDAACLENILNVSFLGVRSEILLHALESKGIYVSAGSACASNAPAPSPTLTAMGKTAKEIDSALRFSFSEFNTEAQMKSVADALQAQVAEIRKYVR